MPHPDTLRTQPYEIRPVLWRNPPGQGNYLLIGAVSHSHKEDMVV